VTTLEVTFGPGVAGQPHRRPGPIFGYVLGTKRYATAATLYAEAIELDAGLVRDLRAGPCRKAARAAALAVYGRGKDDPSPDDSQKVKLRGQALAWLKAELAAWADSVTPGSTQTRHDAFYMLRG
jgi:hypothetical protein